MCGYDEHAHHGNQCVVPPVSNITLITTNVVMQIAAKFLLRKSARREATKDKTCRSFAKISTAAEISCKTERLNNVIYERAKNGKRAVIITGTASRSGSNLNGRGTNGFSKLRVFE